MGNFGKIDVAGRPRTGPNIAGHEELRPETVKAFPDEPLRAVVYRMAEKGVTRLPVAEAGTRKFLGLVSLNDLLKARHLEEERRRERVLNLRFFLPGTGAQDETQSPAAP